MNSTTTWEVSPVVATPDPTVRDTQQTGHEVRLLQAQVAQSRQSIRSISQAQPTTPAPHIPASPPPTLQSPAPQFAPEHYQQGPVLPGMPTSPILPLYTLLSKETRDIIATGEYVDFATLTSKGQDELQKSPKSPFLTPTAWARAASRYASALLITQPQEAQNLLVYIDSILQLADDGGDWPAYDRQFRKQKEAGKYSFGAMRVELYTRAMSSHSRQKEQPYRATRDPHRATDIPPSYCFAYHDPNKRCPNPESCTYSHACYSCEGRHPKFMCDMNEGCKQAKESSQKPAVQQPAKRTAVHAS